jgi:hypothetical protein
MGIEHSKHIFRVFILLAVVLVSVFIGRIVFIKATLPSFGVYGHYRGDSVAENAAQEIRHGGNDACGECHDEIKADHDGGAHLAVPCEDCHDALATHVRDGDKIADMPRVKSVLRLCGRCHRELDARPEDFPQVNIKTHPEEMGAEPSDDVCFECHSPHDPAP